MVELFRLSCSSTSVIRPFLDPVTQTKLNLPASPDITSVVPASQLDTSFGGSVTFPKYGPEEHSLYWKGPEGIVALAMERERQGLEAWRKLPEAVPGSGVGRREWDYKAEESTWGVGGQGAAAAAA
jgi:hypothetical protein